MLFLALNGSPDADGNTAFLLEKGLERIRLMGGQTEMIQIQRILREMKNPFCTACSNPCKGSCAVGTPLEQATELIRKADGLLLGSPVYIGSVSGQLKAFWDKLRRLRGEKALLNVVGGALAVGASRFGGQEQTIKTMHEMMLVQGMTIVGPGHEDYDCGHHGVASQRPSAEDAFAQERVLALAQRMFETAEATKGLRKR